MVMLRRVAGMALIAWGAWLVASSVVHYDAPLAPMPSKFGEPVYFPFSPPLGGFFLGIMTIWMGWHLWSGAWRRKR
jgi:hypothetical protein